MVRAQSFLGTSIVVFIVAAAGLGLACGGTTRAESLDGGSHAGATSSSAHGAGGSGGQGSVANGGTTACSALAACCAALTGASLSACDGMVIAGNGPSCAAYLEGIEAGGSCTGVPTGGDSGSFSSGPTNSGGTESGGASKSHGTSEGTTGGSTSITTTTTSSESSIETSTGVCTVPKLYPEAVAGVYCPFTLNDGGHTFCDPPNACIEPDPSDAGVYPPSVCGGPGDPNAVVLECLEAIDCAGNGGGPLCCGVGTPLPETCNGTSYDKVMGFRGTNCATACTDFTVCEAPADCPSGQTCVPTDAFGNNFGICTAG